MRKEIGFDMIRRLFLGPTARRLLARQAPTVLA